jgi:hypothetical protein
LTALEQAMEGPWGQLIHRAFSLRRDLKMGLRYGPADITALEHHLLDIIDSEMPTQPELPHGQV